MQVTEIYFFTVKLEMNNGMICCFITIILRSLTCLFFNSVYLAACASNLASGIPMPPLTNTKNFSEADAAVVASVPTMTD